MNEIFYVDRYFLTNFLMDLVSLAIGALSASRKVSFWRLSLASAVGALFSTGLVLLQAGPVMTVLSSVLVFAGMIALCFGIRHPRRWVKPALFSFAGAVFLGGAAEVISFYVLPRGSASRLGLGVLCGSVLLGVGIYSLWGKHIHQKLETAVVSLSITYGGRCEHYFGLVDSGLLLRDPDAGRPVLLLKAEYAEPLLPREFIRKMELGELSGEERLVCVPIRSVGGSRDLLAFLPERVQVITGGRRKKNKEERDVLIALDFSRGGFGGCPCLVPLSVI
ncbi:MAG: hypothetical protein E7580_02450 [Ruminococcaceae bacterium]|nr:hypothetical protein [Oscillospiraceae bacterium]